jgi:hypothetical protein
VEVAWVHPNGLSWLSVALVEMRESYIACLSLELVIRYES